MVIDELGIFADDMNRIEDGKTSEVEETLAWLADNTAMTLAALSSTSLLDKVRDEAAVSQTKLDMMIARTRFKTMRLNHIMRSCHNIAAATLTDSVNETQTYGPIIQEAMSPGSSSSTVPGTRPKALLYKWTGDVHQTFIKVDHRPLAGFVLQHLRTLPTGFKVVVLCDREISARQLSDLLRREHMPIACYHGGVERFYGDTPHYRKDGANDGGEAELSKWLEAPRGILVTHEPQFRGCEADAVICVSKDWAIKRGCRRSPVTRAVAHLCLITSDWGINVPEMKKNWELETLEEGVTIE